MSTNCDISIVLPVFNRRDLVRRTLDSILNQSFRPFKLIIVDNNSTDGSLEVVSLWAEEHRSPDFPIEVISETRPGAAMARQAGLERVNTPYVMFFDSDDTMSPDHLRLIADNISLHPDADIIGWDIMLHRPGLPDKRLTFSAGNPIVNHIFHASLATLRYIVKTELIRQVGGWETDIRGWDDYVLGLKLLLANPSLHKIKGPINVDIYAQPQSVTGSSFSEKAGEWEAALDRCQQIITSANRPELIKWINARRAIIAGTYTSENNPLGQRQIADITAATPSRYDRWALGVIYRHLAAQRRGTGALCKSLLWWRR